MSVQRKNQKEKKLKYMGIPWTFIDTHLPPPPPAKTCPVQDYEKYDLQPTESTDTEDEWLTDVNDVAKTVARDRISDDLNRVEEAKKEHQSHQHFQIQLNTQKRKTKIPSMPSSGENYLSCRSDSLGFDISDTGRSNNGQKELQKKSDTETKEATQKQMKSLIMQVFVEDKQTKQTPQRKEVQRSSYTLSSKRPMCATENMSKGRKRLLTVIDHFSTIKPIEEPDLSVSPDIKSSVCASSFKRYLSDHSQRVPHFLKGGNSD